LKLCLEVLLRVLPWLHRSYEVLMLRITSLVCGAMENRTPYGVAPEPQVESKNQLEGHISLESSLLTLRIYSKNK
jgi:hypothetical protein